MLGEGGFIPAPAEFLRELRRITLQHGIVLIVDEIQTGFGRTGKLFAVQNSAVEPDLIAVAKSLAGGLPLSGVIGRAEMMDAPTPGGLGGTYGGNPLACAAALAVLDILEEEQLLERAQQLGTHLRECFTELQRFYTQIGDVRGLGAMMAFELVRDPLSKQPAPELTDRLLVTLRERGLLALKAGLYGNVLRVLVPLTIEWPLLEQALELLKAGLREVLAPAEQAAALA